MNYYELALVFHLLGVALGLGGATVSDILFLKSLKDEKITKAEKDLLEGASLVVWGGIGILLVTGAVMFALNWDVLSNQSRMLAHVTIAFVIIVNGIFLNYYISPKISKLSIKKDTVKTAIEPYRKIRKLAFMSGAVSITSWYLTLILGFARRFIIPPYSYLEIMGTYILFEIIAIAVVLLIENASWKKHKTR